MLFRSGSTTTRQGSWAGALAGVSKVFLRREVVVGKMLGLGSKEVVVCPLLAGKKRGQEGKGRQEKVLVRVSGKFFVQSVVGGKVRAERKEGE